jgi:hypothetical protein
MMALRATQARQDAYEAHRRGVAQCAFLMERAIKTLHALPEPDRMRSFKGAWPDVVRDWHDYGRAPATMPRFRPTPRDVSNMLDVLGWITWLEQQNDGRRDAQIIVARAFGVPWWLIGERFGRNQRTIQRWYDGAVACIYARFSQQVVWLVE